MLSLPSLLLYSVLLCADRIGSYNVRIYFSKVGVEKEREWEDGRLCNSNGKQLQFQQQQTTTTMTDRPMDGWMDGWLGRNRE